MISEIIVRQEKESDFKEVFDLNTQAFGGTVEARLVEALRKSDEFIPQLSLVALNEGKIVGHILFTKIDIAGVENHVSLALAPVAVSPVFQKQGIGSTLIETGLAEARKLGFSSVIVLGHGSYYPKFGFKPAIEFGITTDYNAPDSTFALELIEGALKGVSGRVIYPPEFSLVS